MSTFGPIYDGAVDGERLRRQHQRIKELMLDGAWRTLSGISGLLQFPESSVSAQLRHLRKVQFGSYTVEKRRCGPGLWEYRVTDPRLEIEFTQEGQGVFA